MSKERAQRRAEREREAALRAAARAAEAERAERKEARKQALTRWLPKAAPKPTGALAERRRQQTGLMIAVFILVNVLVWVFFPDWSARAMVAVLSLLIAPLVHAMYVRN
jgi:Flp pilus assembly protein TadB